MTDEHQTVLPDAPAPASGSRAPLLAGLALVVLGVVMVREAFSVPVGRDLISGPRLFPVVITIVFLALAVCYLGQELVKVGRSLTTHGERLGDWGRVSAMTALLLAYGFALEPVGYIISTFVLFLGGSWLLGSRAWRRDVAVGLGLSVGIYFLFTQLLAVPLPAGVIPVG